MQDNRLFRWLLFIGVAICIVVGTVVQVVHTREMHKVELPHSNLHITNDLKVLIDQNAQLSDSNDYASAYGLFLQSRFAESYQAMLPLAVNGNMNAILVVGYLNEFGRGVPQSHQQAALWYYYAAVPNQYNQLAIQRGVIAYDEGSYADAASWLRMAVELRLQ